MFKWDGSDVTDFIKHDDVKIYEGINGKRIYWLILNKEEYETVMVRSSTHTLPCLIDELKSLFGLIKIGTHWLKLNNKIYIISKLEFENGDILEEMTLDQYGYDKNIENEVQKIFLFRELLGVSKNYEKYIILRKKQFFIQPISFYEPNMTPSNSGKVLPNTILEKWFSKTDLDRATRDFFHINDIEKINDIILELMTKMEKIFNRVDSTAVTNISEIGYRIRGRLQFIL